ncbi:DUF1351 domain-containing protein [Clostridium neonatale]|uniref:DUF1351 domain-containing protein n=1 Tax=Clostridium neonatale TaxID=137838 RepID=UPI00291BDF4F|nr:DUF1351 domain-containing protein [Clostridium neonatale]CAI3700709.1 DUF1351 domain-containing protein [Clostridium neonatale]CAI3704192.1 DUF1351 domain-containing protein [Clostridium neonatale]
MKELEVNKQLPIIKANFDEVKESLNQSLEKYKGIIVTEETLQDCKKTQQDLSKVKNGIETFRKSVKKDMEVPIKEFEAKCKELVSLIGEVEQPIKDGITVFDNKRREEKRTKALEFIKDAVAKHGLDEKRASKLTVIDKYLNLSASGKSVKEDIEQRALMLLQEQDRELGVIQVINGTIKAVNEGINTKLKIDDFKTLIEMNTPVARIIEEIHKRAEKIKEAEKPKEEIKVDPPKEEVSIPVDLAAHTPAEQKEEKLYFYELKIIADAEHMLKLKELIQSEGFKYETINKGIVNK